MTMPVISSIALPTREAASSIPMASPSSSHWPYCLNMRDGLPMPSTPLAQLSTFEPSEQILSRTQPNMSPIPLISPWMRFLPVSRNHSPAPLSAPNTVSLMLRTLSPMNPTALPTAFRIPFQMPEKKLLMLFQTLVHVDRIALTAFVIVLRIPLMTGVKNATIPFHTVWKKLEIAPHTESHVALTALTTVVIVFEMPSMIGVKNATMPFQMLWKNPLTAVHTVFHVSEMNVHTVVIVSEMP